VLYCGSADIIKGLKIIHARYYAIDIYGKKQQAKNINYDSTIYDLILQDIYVLQHINVEKDSISIMIALSK
jgi:hypothetical protein